ncbi:hypothetical protein BGZ93_004546 [Podila epicladia]|nr:hypothetical protein BGZ92_000891 [Podila epicladia]KAG0096422.1 hypothetical protein BGZ93_004546 [Podila epicladia]
MLSLPRSPIIKSCLALLTAVSLITLALQFRIPSLQKQVADWGELKQSYKDIHWQQQQQEGNKDGAKIPVISNTDKEHPPVKSFKIPDSLLLTHDIAIPHDIPPWTADDTALLGTTIGATLQAQMLKLDYHKHEDLSGNPPERLNFAELARAERLYKALWNYVYPVYQTLNGRNDREREKALYRLAAVTRPEIDFFLRLEKRLFPWVQYVRRTSFSLFETYNGKGIVFCAGNPQFEFVITSIQAIRNRLKSTLPIQIFYMGEDDLSRERQEYLRTMASDIELFDVTQILDNEYMQLGGWAIKPFAMLASSFEEVMFVDADAYFLQDPATLFTDPGYLATGALFFYDRTLFPGWAEGSDWLKTILPIMSSFPRTSRWFRLISAHEQESGVVLINKRTRFLGLLATAKMNSKWERDLVSYRIFHGDKETFWTGFEMVQEPYAFVRSYGGVIGELRSDNNNSVCGAQLHEDHKGQPLWWNGGLYRNKNSGATRYLDFGYWMTGGGKQKHRERFTNDPEQILEVMGELGLNSQVDLKLERADAVWDFGESCLAGAEVRVLSEKERELANGFVGIDRLAREDGRKMEVGEALDPMVHDWDAV